MRFIVLVTALGLTACGINVGLSAITLKNETDELKALRASDAKMTVLGQPQPGGCELTLTLEHDSPIGVPAFATVPVCIKPEGGPLGVPTAPITLLFAKNDRLWSHDDWKLCRKGEFETAEGTVKRCTWNRVFRDAYPMTMILRATGYRNVSAVVGTARVFRNGALVYTSTPGSLDRPEVVIRGGALVGRMMPFDADLSLRLMPSGIAVAEQPLYVQPDVYVNVRAAVLKLTQEALAAAATDPVECAGLAAKEVFDFLKVLAPTLQNPLAGYDKVCDDATLAKHITTVHDELDKIARAWSKAKDLTDFDADASLKDLAAKLRDLDWDGISARLKTLLHTKVPTELLDNLMAIFKAAKGDLEKIPARVRVAFEKLRSSPKAQAELYGDVVKALAAPATPVRTPNPIPLQDEASLEMRYRDYFQVSYLSAWTGAPIELSTSKGKVENSLNATNLVPLLDIYGHRYLDSTTTWGWGFGIMGFTETNRADDADVFRFGAQVNLRVAGFQLGMGYILAGTDGLDRDPTKRDCWRLVVGADLYKLIVGENAEATDGDTADPEHETQD